MLSFIKSKKCSSVFLFFASIAVTGFSESAAAASFNYGEALQKAVFFYDIQRLGKVSLGTGFQANRVYWRGDSFLQDYALPNAEGVIDLGGGFADAGDNVKFNFPMAAAMTVLAWGVVDFYSAYQSSGQLTPVLANLRWGADYLSKSWDAVNGRLYGQVSPDSVGAEHGAFWMPYEVIDQASKDKSLPRYGFYVDAAHPGTDLAGETVAALSAASLAFKPTDSVYSAQLLTTAKAVFAKMVNVSNQGKYSDNMGRMSGGAWQKADVSSFYNSWSGFNDEVAWSAMWLYRATGDATYIPIAEKYITYGNTAATLSWDDKSYGAYLLMAKFLPDGDPAKAKALASAQGWLDVWSKGGTGHSFSKDGLAIATALAPWGNARYAATTAFGALIYDSYFASSQYDVFAKNQIDYLLGNNSRNFSYMCGFGASYPKQPHHATAEGRWDGNNDVQYPGDNRHIDYGGLVGGPKDTNDTYTDDRGDYIGNEVALDYNAGFTGALAALYGKNGGTPLSPAAFPPTAALEHPPADQFFVNGAVQSAQSSAQQSVIQVDLLATNHSAWPARVTNNLKLRYFINISDKPTGAALPKIQTYSTDSRAVVSGPVAYDAAKGIYYIEVWFKDIPIYPGGDDRSISSKETQIQITYPWAHDFTKDWSYAGLGSQGTMKEAPNIPIYLVNSDGSSTWLFGSEPANVPQGVLTVNFAATLPSACIGAMDTLKLSSGENPTLTVGTTPFAYTTGVGGPFTVSLASTLSPLAVTGGTCKGLLNLSAVSVPGTLTATYSFTATPPPQTGTLKLSPSSTSDVKCNAAVDTLTVDGAGGTAFTVSTGLSKTLTTGAHTLKLASEAGIPAGGGLSGICTGTLSGSAVTIQQNLTTSVTASYQYQGSTPGMSCTITSSKVTQKSDWGGVVPVDMFAVTVSLQGFPNNNGQISLSGNFEMKNPFMQNFWGNFGMQTSSFTGSKGSFTGSLWGTQFTLGGFISDTVPLAVGDNPLVSMTLNGVVCH